LIDEGIISEENIPEMEQVSVDKEKIIKDENNEIEEEGDTTEEDELLAFYEQELAAMEEDSPEVFVFEEELTEDTKDSEVVLTDEEEHEEILDELIEETQNVDASVEEESPQIIEEDLTESSEPDVTTGEEKEQVEIKDEQTETTEEDIFTKEDFDFSIFDDEEGEKIVNEIIDRLSEDSEEENPGVTETPEIPDEDGFEIEPDIEIADEDKKKDDIPLEKKIVDEMLEDYFSDDSKKEMDEDATKMPTDETDILHDEKSSPAVDEKITENNDEGVFDTDLASSILEGSSFEDDISNMIDEIDDIIEENARTFKEPVKNTKIPETKDIEETPADEKFEFEEETPTDSPSFKEPIIEKKNNRIPRAEVPKREKDLFSYLSRKEVKKIVSNVFLGDDEDFVTTIEKISECGTYKEATEILKGVFFTYRVSPYSKDAVILTNAVSLFFRQA